MLFDDDFAYGRWGNEGLDGLFGGPARFDAGEIIITGRVPGALYMDDLPGGMTALDRILPFQYLDGQLQSDVLDAQAGHQFEAPAVITTDGSDAAGPDAGAQSSDPDAGLQSITAAPKGEEKPLVLITQEDGSPLSGLGDFNPVDFGRPPIDLTPVPVVITVTPPDMGGGEQPSPVIPGGRAYQSLAFLLIDTPFVVGDEHLPPTVRPPLNELLGLPDEDDAGQTWVLPATGRGAWVLR